MIIIPTATGQGRNVEFGPARTGTVPKRIRLGTGIL